MIRNGNIAACSKHSRRLPGYKHNHRHRNTKVAWERRPYLFFLIVTFCLVICLFFTIDCFHCCFLSLLHFMSFAFSNPIIFCAYRLSTSMPRDNRCAIPGIKFHKTYACTCFELTLTCLVLARLIFSRKKRCILWPFKLTSGLFLLVNNIRSNNHNNKQQQHLHSPSTHADKVKKNNISVCTQLSLELK